MRLRISHSTSYRYEPPATGVIQILRMTPGSHDGQYVAEWQIDVSTDTRLDVHQDAFGNVTHVLTYGPIADLTIHVEGLIETHDTGGVLRGSDERFPSSLFLRSVSALTAYHWVYRETLKPWLIADLLILNDSLPRSLASCYGNLVRNLDQIGVAYGRQGAAQRHARGVRNRLEHSHMDDIFQHGVHEFIQEFISDNSRLGEIITKQYLI